MSCVYPKGKRLYMRVKDEMGLWRNKATPYFRGEEDKAERFAAAAQTAIDRKRQRDEALPLTVRQYTEQWNRERLGRVRSAKGELGRFEKFIFPRLGDMPLTEVTPEHVRDLVRDLRRRDIAPRSVLHIYSMLHNVFDDAETEGKVVKNPVKVKRGVLPTKVDKDPEWRAQATYTTEEISILIGSGLVPIERRVQYALKALAGMRHGEVAALRWRHIDTTAQPLGRMTIAVAYDSHACEEKRTKTSTTRQVPIHPVLAGILESWREDHWEEVYGRPPTEDDLVVPTRNMTHVNASDAVHSLRLDLKNLDLRLKAGKHRHRGGHDLRGWFITQTVEDGADSNIIRRCTHSPPRDVVSGYQRFSWAVLCREVSKLDIGLSSLEVSVGTGEYQALVPSAAPTEEASLN